MRQKASFLQTALVRGTLLLTICAVLSKFCGFFFRILLSNLLGAEGMGIYQLSFPVFGIGYSFCCAGLETAISRFTAASECEDKEIFGILHVGLTISLLLSFICSTILYVFANPIAVTFLQEARTEPLVRILALSIPFAAIHGCIMGHYLGKKEALFPGLSQLFEQAVRVGTAILCFYFCEKNEVDFTPAMAVLGILTSEISAAILFVWLLHRHKIPTYFPRKMITPLVKMATPLTASRLSMTFLSSVEAILIPSRLMLYGLTTSESLSTYGILTGMALPFLLFPCTLTGSAATLLLPEIAEAAARNNRRKIQKAAGFTVAFCLGFGCFCTLFFFFAGKSLGLLVFRNITAGAFLQTLSFLSPFLFLSTMLGSILNGLGFTVAVFTHNLIGIGIRLCFTLFLIPQFGIHAVLWGLLADKAMVSILHIVRFQRYSKRFT